jgi:hypothetical protein
MAKSLLSKLQPSQLHRGSLGFLIALLMGIVLSVWGPQLGSGGNLPNLSLAPATAQILRPENVAEQVYQRLPDLPRENQYLSEETGAVATDNTLISRLVRYHQYVKSRPTRFRLDWQFTLADYLGVNEPIKESRYPGATTLNKNPLEADLQVIGSLNRRQRSELVDVLVSIYNPQAVTPSKPESAPPSTTQPSQPSPPSQPNLSQPGDAQLLIP